MFLKTKTNESTEDYWQKISEIRERLADADAVLVGAGAGLSTAAGMEYGGERFENYFSDFHKKYGFSDMYSGGFYPFRTQEEYWAYWSRAIFLNRYDGAPGKPYTDLLKLLESKEYFVLTTNVDHCFQRAGFNKDRLFYTQGDYGLWQCSTPCCQRTYDNKETVLKMVNEQKDMKIPSELVPKCPVCGAPMTMNLRIDDTFVQDSGWYAAAGRYNDFAEKYKGKKLLLLELGVGYNTPGIIKYPFWRTAAENKNAAYVCINYGEAICPKEIAKKAICLDTDIAKALGDLIPE